MGAFLVGSIEAADVANYVDIENASDDNFHVKLAHVTVCSLSLFPRFSLDLVREWECVYAYMCTSPSKLNYFHQMESLNQLNTFITSDKSDENPIIQDLEKTIRVTLISESGMAIVASLSPEVFHQIVYYMSYFDMMIRRPPH